MELHITTRTVFDNRIYREVDGILEGRTISLSRDIGGGGWTESDVPFLGDGTYPYRGLTVLANGDDIVRTHFVEGQMEGEEDARDRLH